MGRARQQPAAAPVPPQNLEAEESVLGAMMLSPNAVDAVAEEIVADDFYRGSHGHIYDAALALHTGGQPVDAVTVVDYLDGAGLLEAAGGRQRVHELAALVPATANAKHYAEIVRTMSVLRGFIRVGQEIARLGWERPGDLPDLIDQAEQLVYGIARARTRHEVATVGATIRDAFDELVALYESGSGIVGLSTGYLDLDKYTSGLQRGNMIVLAARPSMGKSALVLCILNNVTLHQGKPAALFTLEMNTTEVQHRLMSIEGQADSQRMRTGQLSQEEWSRVTFATDRLSRVPLYVDDSRMTSAADLRGKARRLKSRHPDLALIVVDYLQLMAPGTEESRVQQVSQLSRQLKILAGDLDIPVIAISQLSRAVENRHDRRPLLSDLRESGSIEADADVVLMLYRDEYYNPEEVDQRGIAELNIAKQRNGPTTVVKLAFVKRYARFNNLSKEQP